MHADDHPTRASARVTKRIAVGFTGGSGAGKSRLADRLESALGKRQVTRLSLDDYYLPRTWRTPGERETVNYDEPAALDWPLFRSHLGALKAGLAVSDAPIYDFRTHNRTRHTRTLSPASVVIVDGILLLADEKVRSLLDLRVFVDASADLRLLRRLTRDLSPAGRGRRLPQLLAQYIATVRPMHFRYVEAAKPYCHVILNNDLGTEETAGISHEVVTAGLVSVIRSMAKRRL